MDLVPASPRMHTPPETTLLKYAHDWLLFGVLAQFQENVQGGACFVCYGV